MYICHKLVPAGVGLCNKKIEIMRFEQGKLCVKNIEIVRKIML